DQLLAPGAAIHIVGALSRDGAERRREFRLLEDIALDISAAVGLDERRARFGKAADIAVAELEDAVEHLADRHALLGDMDRGLEQTGEGQLAEALVCSLDALHEAA